MKFVALILFVCGAICPRGFGRSFGVVETLKVGFGRPCSILGVWSRLLPSVVQRVSADTESTTGGACLVVCLPLLDVLWLLLANLLLVNVGARIWRAHGADRTDRCHRISLLVAGIGSW